MKQLELFTPYTRDERQDIGVKKWIKSKCCGTLEYPTGTGKTYTAIKCLRLILSKYPHFRVLIVVPTQNLQDQWQGYIDKEGWFNCEIQIINTVIKHEWTCNILIIDEIHRTGADQFKQIFKCVHYKYILGLTATFERLDGKDLLIREYCPIIDKITTEEALFNGWISKYKEYAVLIEVDDIDYYNQLNKEFYEHFEFFGLKLAPNYSNIIRKPF